LDEFSSSLDAATESTILKNIKEFTNGKTTLFIAHRLSTVMDCDVIFVIGHGKIVEFGSHAELMELKREYFRLWETQQELKDREGYILTA
jgi:ATP-binding cassette subfamily B protein